MTKFSCKSGPFYRHGFLRNASLTEDRYVCECEYHEPEVYWFDCSDDVGITQLSEFLDVELDECEYVNDVVAYITFEYLGRKFKVMGNQYVAVNEEKTRLLICTPFDFS